jgi:hypothetical protein
MPEKGNRLMCDGDRTDDIRGSGAEMSSANKTNTERAESRSDRLDLQNSMTRHAQKPTARLGREAQVRIGEQLRALYTSYVNQGIPPELAALINKLTQ